MAYIPPETIADVKKIDLLTYLQTYEPDELVHISGNEYSTKTHDSLKISNGVWHWHSQGIAGKTALQYLIKIKGMEFTEAANMLINTAALVPPVFMPESKQPQRKPFQLPPANTNNYRVMSYLLSRGIDKEVITHCIRTGRLYEDEKFNAVFVDHDESGTARYAALRGTGEVRFMGEVAGSDKRFSFSLTAKSENTRLHIFESAIDLLSFSTMQKIKGIDFRQSNLLSLGGVGSRTQKESGNLPLALEQFLTQHPQIEKVFFHLDNDEPGRQATSAIMVRLPKHIAAIDISPSCNKDVNDMLKQYLNDKKPKRKVLQNERI